ncbi:hypothetical protein ASPCADRAFT_212053 [Aspergillus carbonarius ITEM 5010]|uniref:Uncharacterized protein n=1 Tax=Aspergillus carbonarius (strain ITEM 5010) TaxID=602072 RepID=A0A1R3R789_ASPC5|nr:hypothetical protein ASPCADRAFT_212053 [Aspergillus carbonarius ITEM 5010]
MQGSPLRPSFPEKENRGVTLPWLPKQPAHLDEKAKLQRESMADHQKPSIMRQDTTSHLAAETD